MLSLVRRSFWFAAKSQQRLMSIKFCKQITQLLDFDANNLSAAKLYRTKRPAQKCVAYNRTSQKVFLALF